ncbi:MAG: thioredoxin family protein [Saprospiraceae bacterium]|nr:thioredoxin family protein [Saprospiraceae bacterium]
MKASFLPLLLLCTASLLPAQPVHFLRSGRLAEILAQAKTSDKLVFIDVYTDWCGPCKMMDQLIFSDPEIAGRLNAFFINVKADAEGKGRALKEEFRVKGYPTLLFLSAEGDILQQLPGAPDKNTFLLLLNSALEFSAEGQVFLSYDQAWASGQQRSGIAAHYLALRARHQIPNDGPIADLLYALPADSLDQPAMQQLLARYATDIDGAGFEYLLAHKSVPRCATALQRNIDAHFKNAIAHHDEKVLKTVLDATLRAAPEEESALHRMFALRMQFYLETQQPDRFHHTAAEYVPTHLLPLLQAGADTARLQGYAQALGNIAWQYASFVKKKKQLHQALDWIGQCPESLLSDECRRQRDAIAQLLKN